MYYTAPVDGPNTPRGVSQDPLEGLRDAMREVATVVRGKEAVIELAFTACVAGGHILIEDIPGVGKSTLARALSRAIGGSFHRIQFTSDLLPADLIGTNMWMASMERFEFRKGPVFANIILADEVNRAPPRTQSALLEAMSERQVSMDGTSMPLPSPFIVVATQNPLEHHGTYPLPEAQKDRFLIRTSMGYPDETTEVALLAGGIPKDPDSVKPTVTLEALHALQQQAAEIYVHPDVAGFARRFVAATRSHPSVTVGVSTRGALAWLALARADALLKGATLVGPDALQRLAVPALAHRLTLSDPGAATASNLAEEVVRDLLSTVPVPR